MAVGVAWGGLAITLILNPNPKWRQEWLGPFSYLTSTDRPQEKFAPKT